MLDNSKDAARLRDRNLSRAVEKTNDMAKAAQALNQANTNYAQAVAHIEQVDPYGFKSTAHVVGKWFGRDWFTKELTPPSKHTPAQQAQEPQATSRSASRSSSSPSRPGTPHRADKGVYLPPGVQVARPASQTESPRNSRPSSPPSVPEAVPEKKSWLARVGDWWSNYRANHPRFDKVLRFLRSPLEYFREEKRAESKEKAQAEWQKGMSAFEQLNVPKVLEDINTDNQRVIKGLKNGLDEQLNGLKERANNLRAAGGGFPRAPLEERRGQNQSPAASPSGKSPS